MSFIRIYSPFVVSAVLAYPPPFGGHVGAKAAEGIGETSCDMAANAGEMLESYVLDQVSAEAQRLGPLNAQLGKDI